MISNLFREIAAKNGLTVASGMAYGMLNGCFVTLSGEADVQRISIYIGGQEQPAPGYQESRTVSCARQILHTISTASGADNAYALLSGNESIPPLVLNHAGSVVTVNFPDVPEASAGIERFIAELLPVAAPLTRPQQCIFCCQTTSGDACPVRLSADTVVPMHVPCYQKAAGIHTPTPEERSVQRRAILGAALGALVGAILWALLSGFGPAAWIAGIAMGLLPTIAYDLLKGKPGKPRIATILVCALAALFLGSLGACLIDLVGEYQRNLTVMNAKDVGFLAYIPAGFIKGDGVMKGFVTTLIAGFVTGAIGCMDCFRRTGNTETAAAADKPRRLKGKF